MTNPRRFSTANGTSLRWLRLARAGLLLFPALFAVPVAAGMPGSSSPTPVLKSIHTTVAPPSPAPEERRPSAPSPPADAQEAEELRGLWVVRTSLVSPESVHQVVVTAVKYHLNALFVQVRGRGDAWYASPYEPRAEGLAHQPSDFDPLAQMVAEAHANGIQVHAWLNTYLTWSGPHPPASPQHLWNAHRDWFACDRQGRCSCLPTNTCEGAYLQPSNPAVQDHLFRVFTSVATNYDVDGIHFDYCRYAGSSYDFSAATLARFRASMTPPLESSVVARLDGRLKHDRLAYVHAFSPQWAAWRRDQITALVARISAAVKEAKPWMQVSAAVFPDADEAFAVRGQDWRGWLQAGYLDAVALMAYGNSTGRILQETRHAVAAAGGRHVYTGIGAWHLQAHDVAQKIAALRRTGAAGINLFSYDGVHTRSHYLDTLARGVFASRAAPPRMRWLPSRGPIQRTPATDPEAGR